jgi:hypothetical protein
MVFPVDSVVLLWQKTVKYFLDASFVNSRVAALHRQQD